MEFKDVLKKLRRDKGITQEELGRAICISRSAIAKWEAGLGMPGADSLAALSEYFGVSEELLLPPPTRELIIDKNADINRGRRLTATLLAVIAALIIAVSVVFGAYLRNGQRRADALEALLTTTPRVTKMYFEHPNSSGILPDVKQNGGRYVLPMASYTQIYFEIELYPRLLDCYYEITPEFTDCMDALFTEHSTYVGGNGEVIRIICSVYIRPTKEMDEIALASVGFDIVVEGRRYEKECAVECAPVKIFVD